MGTVSVIIPIYNVEKYLRDCVDSVLEQTYPDLQIILVDDGSTDSSGQICDEYAGKDSRIQVVHKENGGLSDARNAGLTFAAGAFLLYLDSDDYLAPDAVEKLMKMQEKTGADVAFGNFFYTYPDHEDVARAWHRSDTVLDNRQAMEALVDGRLETFAWGKLIRSEIAKRHLFPKGKVFEDHFWTHFVFADAEKVAVTPQPLVYYRQRDNSISYTFDLKRLDMLEGWVNRKEFLEQQYPELLDVCFRRYAERYAGLAWLVLTRMKGSRRKGFEKLRSFNAEYRLQNYAQGTTMKLICALDKGSLVYAVYALWFRLVRR